MFAILLRLALLVGMLFGWWLFATKFLSLPRNGPFRKRPPIL
jgi:hypothetical protein